MTRWLEQWITRFGLDALPALRRFLIGAIGFSVILIGLIMIVLPGPAFIVVPLGVAILASEFAWARRVWRRGRILISRVRGKPIPRKRSKRNDQAPLAPGARQT
jgi:putative transmembrane protein PGPGW